MTKLAEGGTIAIDKLSFRNVRSNGDCLMMEITIQSPDTLGQALQRFKARLAKAHAYKQFNVLITPN